MRIATIPFALALVLGELPAMAGDFKQAELPAPGTPAIVKGTALERLFCRDFDAYSKIASMFRAQDKEAATKVIMRSIQEGKCDVFDGTTAVFIVGESIYEPELAHVRAKGEPDEVWVQLGSLFKVEGAQK